MVSVTLLTVLVFAFLWRKAPVPVIGEVSVCFWLSVPARSLTFMWFHLLLSLTIKKTKRSEEYSEFAAPLCRVKCTFNPA